MKKRMLKKALSILAVALFVISLAGVAISHADQETTTIKGKIISIDAENSKIELQDEAGNTVSLATSPNTDMKDCSTGDQVSVECGSDGVVTVITK